jgi:hypothetical protein
LRNLVIASKRKDPQDLGNYAWAEEGQGLTANYWDNARFSDWIKFLWETGQAPSQIDLVKEGRFHGIEVDAMDTPRQTEAYFAEAERIRGLGKRLRAGASALTSCKSVFQLGLQ